MNYFPKPRKGKLPKNVDKFGMYKLDTKISNLCICYINLNIVNNIYI